MADFTYQDCDSHVLLAAMTPRAALKMRTDIQPTESFQGVVAILNPEEGRRIRYILTVYEHFTVETQHET